MIWVFPDTLFNPVTTGSTVTLNRSTVTAGYVYRRAAGAGNGLPSFGTLTTADLPAGALTILGTSGSLSLASASTLTLVGSGITCTLTGTTALPTMTLAAAAPTVTSVDTTNGLYVAAGVLKLSATSSEAFGAIVLAGSMSATTALFSGAGTVTGNWLVGTSSTFSNTGTLGLANAAGTLTYIGSTLTLFGGGGIDPRGVNANSVVIGQLATDAAAGSTGRNIIIGAGAKVFNGKNQSIVIGASASTGASFAVIIGDGAVGGFADRTILIGSGNDANGKQAIGIGNGLVCRADNDIVFGSTGQTGRSPRLLLQGSSSVGNTAKDTFDIAVTWIDSTDATRKCRAVFNIYDTAAREFFRVDANGTAVPVGTLTGSYTVSSSLTITGNLLANGTQNQLETFGLKSGANKSCGTVTLVAGTMTVANTRVTASSIVLVGIVTDGGTPGDVRVSAKSAGTSFTITSSSILDTSIVAWVIVEPS